MFHLSIPLLRYFGKYILLIISKSNKSIDNYFTRVRVNIGSKSYNNFFIYYITLVFFVAGLLVLKDFLVEKVQLKNDIISYLDHQQLEINAENYLIAKKIKENELQLKYASKSLNNIPSLYYSNIFSIFIYFIIGIITIRASVFLSLKRDVEKFTRLIEIVRPEIGEIEYLKLKRDWLLMKSTADYLEIQERLEKK